MLWDSLYQLRSASCQCSLMHVSLSQQSLRFIVNNNMTEVAEEQQRELLSDLQNALSVSDQKPEQLDSEVNMFAEQETSHVVSSEHQSPEPWTLTIYRGFGSDHIVINPVETVYDLLNAVDQRTDWLWGFCRPHGKVIPRTFSHGIALCFGFAIWTPARSWN